MQIIPVIDLLNDPLNNPLNDPIGDCRVVHAKRGQRQHYQAIQSQLTDSCAPLDIVAALLELYPFQTLYIADLNAICGAGNNDTAIEAICKAHPALTIWLDCGIGQMNARALHIGGAIRPVVGSENIENLQDYRAISYACQSAHVLSLDYSATSAMGITELHTSARFWPDDTICMALNAVGSAEGPDMQRLNEMVDLNTARKTPSRIYAAGGVRNMDDLAALASMRVTGALLATALHDGSINTNDLQDLCQNSF